MPYGRAKAVHPVSGISVWRQRFVAGPHNNPERAVLMQVNLRAGSGVHVDTVIPGEAIGATRETVPAQANLAKAVAGVNGDWFDLASTTAVPRGAYIRGGQVLKTPRPGWQANLVVRTDGTLAIGPVSFRGSVRAGKARARVMSVNTPSDAANGGITYLTHALVRFDVPRSCAVAYGRTGRAGRVITSVAARVTSVPRIRSGRWALAACGGTGAQWLRTTLHAGSPVTVSLAFADGKPRTALSGGRVLVQGGKLYTDSGGQRLRGANPMTFACVSRSGRGLLLGVVDGRSRESWGVTQPQLAAYLLQLGCWDGMTFDGGGSSTMASRLPGGGPGVTVLNQPSDGQPRKIADALLVYG